MVSAYRLSTEMESPIHVVTPLGVDGFHQQSSMILKGSNNFLDLHGAWARNALARYFTIQYCTTRAYIPYSYIPAKNSMSLMASTKRSFVIAICILSRQQSSYSTHAQS